jgi:hypothetical protein
MKKPRMKREVSIESIQHGESVIFYASHEAASELSEFGTLFELNDGKCLLYTDNRFDFAEVVEYIKNYG